MDHRVWIREGEITEKNLKMGGIVGHYSNVCTGTAIKDGLGCPQPGLAFPSFYEIL